MNTSSQQQAVTNAIEEFKTSLDLAQKNLGNKLEDIKKSAMKLFTQESENQDNKTLDSLDKKIMNLPNQVKMEK